MAKQTINIGSSANDGTGDPLRTAFDKINDNFTELYGATAEANDIVEDTSPQLGGNLDLNGHSITTARSNENININPAGTGTIELVANTNVTGDLAITGNTTVSGRIFLGDGATDVTQVTGVFEADNLTIDGTTITSKVTNGDVTIQGNGTGVVAIPNLKVDGNISVTDNEIQTTVSNSDLKLSASGTGGVLASALRIHGTTLSADDSSTITLAEGVNITGALTLTGGLASALSVANGGTGATSLTSNAVLTGTGSSAITAESNLTFDGSTLTLTGSAALDGVTVKDNTVSSNTSNSNLQLSGNGTGKVEIMDGITGSFDITQTGNTTITGQADIDYVRIKDNKITTNASNSVLEISANGSGTVDVQNAMTTLGQTVTGNVAITGRADVDNLRIDANSITAQNSNGGITLNPNGTGTVTINGTFVGITNTLSANKVETDQIAIEGNEITTANSNANLELSANGSGAVVLNNLKVGTGATVTTILDEDAMGSDSATALATQQSIKAYVDAVTTSLNAQDLDFQGDSGGALNIDLDTEVLDIAGGTNITTAGSGNTLTVNLDTALTGLTSAVIDNVTIADNSITTNASNANLQLGANGSGKIELMSNTISRTGDIIFDASADIILDAGGKDIIFRYDGAQFGLFTFAGGNLLIQSGSTTMLTGDGANAIFNGNITVPGSSTLDGVTITDNTIKSNASNADLQIGTSGTGVIDILTATQSTVGSAGGASALPGQPTGYIKVKIGGTMRVIPFYDES